MTYEKVEFSLGDELHQPTDLYYIHRDKAKGCRRSQSSHEAYIKIRRKIFQRKLQQRGLTSTPLFCIYDLQPEQGTTVMIKQHWKGSILSSFYPRCHRLLVLRAHVSKQFTRHTGESPVKKVLLSWDHTLNTLKSQRALSQSGF